MTIINLLQISFFSAFVSCGLAVLRNTKFGLMPYIYFCAFITAFVFNGLNSIIDTVVAGIAGGFAAAVLVGIFHRKGIHGYLFIIIPVIYCIGPGGAMYRMFLADFTLEFSTAFTQLIYIFKDAVGIWIGILAGTNFMNVLTKKESEKF